MRGSYNRREDGERERERGENDLLFSQVTFTIREPEEKVRGQKKRRRRRRFNGGLAAFKRKGGGGGIGAKQRRDDARVFTEKG